LQYTKSEVLRKLCKTYFSFWTR